jgi:hypothetical protein
MFSRLFLPINVFDKIGLIGQANDPGEDSASPSAMSYQLAKALNNWLLTSANILSALEQVTERESRSSDARASKVLTITGSI